MTKEEFDALLADSSKRITGNISWEQDKLSHVLSFFVRMTSDDGYPLVIKGSYNRVLRKTSYIMLIGDIGRVFAVDFDRSHSDVGNFHVHRWDGVKLVASKAEASLSIANDPIKLWTWFCREAGITHSGVLGEIPRKQAELFDQS